MTQVALVQDVGAQRQHKRWGPVDEAARAASNFVSPHLAGE
jgi:hypothetical protein